MDFDWRSVRLVVFDVDGTLYRQRPLRLRMLGEILGYTVRTFDLSVFRVVHSYRRVREAMANREMRDFGPRAIEVTAENTGVPVAAVETIVEEWIERRPLRFIARYRYPRVATVFQGLRQYGVVIGVVSDYPAAGKLKALGLEADVVVCASDVGVMKPDPAGIRKILADTGIPARQTVVVGDRADRDGAAARRAGARALIRSDVPLDGWKTFTSYGDEVFRPVLDAVWVIAAGAGKGEGKA